MNRLAEIEARIKAIPEEARAEDADLDALEQEMKDLKEERRVILEKTKERKSKLNSIAKGAGEVSAIVIPKEERKVEMTREEILASKEYRNAFLKKLQGKELTEVEQRSVAAANVAGAVPTQTSEQIFTKLREMAPLLGEVTLLHIAGNVNFAVEGTNNDAAIHTENALISAAADTLVTVSLTGYEVAKLVRISESVRTMTINAFESWLADIIAENIAGKIEYYMVLGTGSSQPKGVDYANTWTDGTNAVDWAAAKPTYAELTELVSYLKGGYFRKAKWLMNHSTFWNDIQSIRDDGKAPIVHEVNGKFFILGKEVLFSDYVPAGDVFLGDFKKIVANLAQDINVKASEHSAFAYNAVDYRGTAIFDCDIAIAEAIVKGAATLTAGA